jgi:hypothetical protein
MVQVRLPGTAGRPLSCAGTAGVGSPRPVQPPLPGCLPRCVAHEARADVHGGGGGGGGDVWEYIRDEQEVDGPSVRVERRVQADAHVIVHDHGEAVPSKSAFGCNDRTGCDETIPQIRLFGSGSRVGTGLSSVVPCCPSNLEGRERTSGNGPVLAVPQPNTP